MKFVGFNNRTAALLVGFLSCLVATVDLLLSTAIAVFGVFHIYNKVQIGVSLSKLCLVFFLPLHFGVKIYSI